MKRSTVICEKKIPIMYSNSASYNVVETSDPANAKSQSCLLHFEGGPKKHPVRYSTQFGPPADVLICTHHLSISISIIFKILTWFWTISSDNRVCGLYG